MRGCCGRRRTWDVLLGSGELVTNDGGDLLVIVMLCKMVAQDVEATALSETLQVACLHDEWGPVG